MSEKRNMSEETYKEMYTKETYKKIYKIYVQKDLQRDA